MFLIIRIQLQIFRKHELLLEYLAHIQSKQVIEATLQFQSSISKSIKMYRKKHLMLGFIILQMRVGLSHLEDRFCDSVRNAMLG